MNKNEIRAITPKEACELLNSGEQDYVLLDVRTAGEFAALHAKEAINMPLHTISENTLDTLKGKKVICLCQKGSRGEQAAKTLSQNGFNDVCNILGGTEAWENAGLPVLRGKSSVSIERQVRIAAGALVTFGAVCGYFITPYAYWISLLVGCGLIFSGVTNTCAMASILVRCPCNSKM